MNEPRPAMISARPPDSRSSVANSWKTRTGSSELSTVTALVSRMSLRALGRRGEHDGRRRDGEVGAVVLPDAEDVEPHLVGELDSSIRLRRRWRAASFAPSPGRA